MMKNLRKKTGVLIIYLGLFTVQAFSNDSTGRIIKFGAFYFDGWSGTTFHISKKLASNFLERKPLNGWITSTQKNIDQQIIQASNAGLSFFNFCWYYNGNSGSDIALNVRNNALQYYLNSPNKSKIGFSLLIANHKGYVIKKEHWPLLIDYWCKLFQNPSYLKVDGAPLITFFDTYSLITTFKNSANVKVAFDQFKSRAASLGISNIRLAICVNNSDEIALATRCGFDIITSYNNHASALLSTRNRELPIDKLITNDLHEWTRLLNETKKAVIPTITLNWDKRPWDSSGKIESKHFVGYSQESVKRSVTSSVGWLNSNNNRMKDKIVFVYAWNEYGEGAWLTPSKKLGDQLLIGLRAGIEGQQ